MEPIYDPDLVTPQWLTHVLDINGAEVTKLDAKDVGTGQVGANVRYRLTWEPEGAGPASVVCKFASRDETSRAAGVATLTYETEVNFYRDLSATVDISHPRCHLAAGVPGTADVVLVMEDLAPAEQGDQVAGCTLEQAELAVTEAAKLHGPRWGDPTLLDLPWLAAGRSAGEGVPMIYAMFWGGFAERYRDTLDDVTIEVGTAFAEKIGDYAAADPGPLTVVHYDYRLDNMLFATPEGGRPLTVVDWQTARLGAGASDVAYFVSAAFPDPAVRRQHEEALVRRYHDTLLGYDVEDYPFERCWEDYARYSYSGLAMAVVASMLVGRTERGDRMFMAMANGAAHQVRDHGVG